MRHKVNRSRLSLSKSQRKALINALARSMIINGRIKTTIQRAKNAKPLVEHLISLGKEGSLYAKRKAYKILQNHLLVSRLFGEIAPKFKVRQGGYSRILRFGRRRGDGTEMALFELTEVIKEIKPESVKKEKEKTKAAEAKSHGEAYPKAQGLKAKEAGVVASSEKPKAAVEEEKRPAEKPKSAPEEQKKHKNIEIYDKKKAHKKFLGGLRSFFKKERDSL